MFGALVLSGNFACKKKKAIETEYVLFNQITQHKGFCSPGWKFAREDDSNVAFAGLINNKIGKGGVKCNASFKKGNINPKFLSWHKCSFTTQSLKIQNYLQIQKSIFLNLANASENINFSKT